MGLTTLHKLARCGNDLELWCYRRPDAHNCDTSVWILLYCITTPLHTTYTIPWLLHHSHLRTTAAKKNVPSTSTTFLPTCRKSILSTGRPSPRASESLFLVPFPLINFSWSFSRGVPQWLRWPSKTSFSRHGQNTCSKEEGCCERWYGTLFLDDSYLLTLPDSDLWLMWAFSRFSSSCNSWAPLAASELFPLLLMTHNTILRISRSCSRDSPLVLMMCLSCI